MNTIEESERLRKRMEAISERINSSLDHHSSRGRSVGIRYENNPEDSCPRCGSGLKRKHGHKDEVQRWECLICHFHYFEKDE